MMTTAPNYALPARPMLNSQTDTQPRGLLEAALHWLQSCLCGLHGHDSVLQYERTRMFLKCTSCGHETPGWEVSTARAPVRMRSGTRKPFVAPNLHVVRKIA